jgi:hypothetical protein
LYSTNPFNNFHAANSKEYISLDKGAKQDFRPKIRFDLIPGNSDAFSAEIKNSPGNSDMDPYSMFQAGAMLTRPIQI